MKKGFTLIELLSVIIILAIILVVAVPKIMDKIEDVRLQSYISNEKILVKAASTYMVVNPNLAPQNIGSTTEIKLSDLKSSSLISKIIDPNDKNVECNGYVLVTKIEEGLYDYTPHMKCGAQNTIANLATDGLILHYKFDDFQEPTSNLFQAPKDTMGVDTTLSTIGGQDEIGKYFIKPVGYLYSWEGIRIPSISVNPGERYTFSMEIMSDVAHNINWDLNVTGGGYVGNDAGRDYGYSSPSRYTKVGTWEKIYITAGVRSDMTSPLASDSHCPIDASVLGHKIYYRNLQLEQKAYSTPYTQNIRDGIVKDYSGNGNNAQLLLTNTPKWTENGRKSTGIYEFDGVNDYIRTDTSISLIGSQTFSAWINPISTSTLRGIVSHHNHVSTANLGLNIIGGKLTVSIGYTDSTREYDIKKSNATIPINMWTHTALVYDYFNNIISFYINGQLDSQHPITKTVKFLSNRMIIGQWADSHMGSYNMQGSIDDVRIYSRALTEKEIKQMYDVENIR